MTRRLMSSLCRRWHSLLTRQFRAAAVIVSSFAVSSDVLASGVNAGVFELPVTETIDIGRHHA